jgi:cell division protein FtsX
VSEYPLSDSPLSDSPLTELPLSDPAGSEPAPRRLGLYVVVAVVALLVGALGASAVFLLAGRGEENRYAVTVFLTEDAGAGQRAPIEAALSGLHPVGDIGFETREQAWQRFKETFKDKPDLISTASADAMPESFRLTTESSEFDCAQLAPVRRLPGIDSIQVVQRPTKGHAGAVIGCG